LAPRAETQKGFMSSAINGSFAYVMVLYFVLCARDFPCQCYVLCVLVQGMFLYDQIVNP
jgi:hypothetical protein